MKKVYLFSMILSINSIYAQVGINQTSPNATLDIQANNTDGSTKEGILIPRLSKSALANMGTDVEESTTVFVNNIDTVTNGTQTATVAQVFEKGFYSFVDGNWKQYRMKDNNTDLSKTYVCTEENLGQVLNTQNGYFICTNELNNLGSELITDDPIWAYRGIMEGYGTYNSYPGEHFGIPEGEIALVEAKVMYNPEKWGITNTTETYYTLNGLYGYDLGRAYQPSVVGISSILPKVGQLTFDFVETPLCALVSYPANYTSGSPIRVFVNYGSLNEISRSESDPSGYCRKNIVNGTNAIQIPITINRLQFSYNIID